MPILATVPNCGIILSQHLAYMQQDFAYMRQKNGAVRGQCLGMTVASLARLKDALGCSWEDLLDGCASRVVAERIAHFRG